MHGENMAKIEEMKMMLRCQKLKNAVLLHEIDAARNNGSIIISDQKSLNLYIIVITRWHQQHNGQPYIGMHSDISSRVLHCLSYLLSGEKKETSYCAVKLIITSPSLWMMNP